MTQPDQHLCRYPPDRAVSSKREREITLAVDSNFRLPRLPGVPQPRHLVTAVYSDRVSHDLAHARITLRRRIEQGKAAWQLKIPLGNGRQEIEITDGQAEPPVSLRDLLILHLDHRTLVPVATLRVWRTGIRVRQGGRPAAVVVLDSVAVVKSNCVPQRFREIEQLGTDQGQLHDLDRLFRRTGAQDHDGRPKLFRVLSLPAPTPDRPPQPDTPARPVSKPGRLHEVRIKTKRARYAAELAMWAVGKPATRFMKRAQVVQNLLGSYQDSFTAETYIRAFLKQVSSVHAGFVAGRMVECQRQRREDILNHVKPKLKALLKWGRKAWV